MIDQVKVDESDKLRLPYLVGHDGVPKELQAAEKGLLHLNCDEVTIVACLLCSVDQVFIAGFFSLCRIFEPRLKRHR